jgi:hypothetical protein
LTRRYFNSTPAALATVLLSFSLAACAGAPRTTPLANGASSDGGVAGVSAPQRANRRLSPHCTSVPGPISVTESFASSTFSRATGFPSGSSGYLIINLATPSSSCNIKIFQPISFFIWLPTTPAPDGLIAYSEGIGSAVSTPPGRNSCNAQSGLTAGAYNFIYVKNASLGLGATCSMAFLITAAPQGASYTFAVSIPANAISSPDISSSNAVSEYLDVTWPPLEIP